MRPKSAAVCCTRASQKSSEVRSPGITRESSDEPSSPRSASGIESTGSAGRPVDALVVTGELHVRRSFHSLSARDFPTRKRQCSHRQLVLSAVADQYDVSLVIRTSTQQPLFHPAIPVVAI